MGDPSAVSFNLQIVTRHFFAGVRSSDSAVLSSLATSSYWIIACKPVLCARKWTCAYETNRFHQPNFTQASSSSSSAHQALPTARVLQPTNVCESDLIFVTRAVSIFQNAHGHGLS
jgi:hypothetical protein